MKETNTIIQAYIVKYALTQGIQKKELIKTSDCLYSDGKYGYYFEKEIAHTEAEAIEKAEAMRVKKIESLRKQITNIETLKIKIK